MESQITHIRWMIRRDLQEVMEIENKSFDNPLTEDEFISLRRQSNCIGMVAEYEEKIVGFFVYELQKSRLHVVNFAVHPDFRHRGIGREMIDKLIDKLSYQRRNQITLEVRETNLDAQLFFRRMGFLAVSILKDRYCDSTEDAYLMRRRYGAEQETASSVLQSSAAILGEL